LSTDVEEWKLPTDQYNATLESLRAEGIDPGRQEIPDWEEIRKEILKDNRIYGNYIINKEFDSLYTVQMNEEKTEVKKIFLHVDKIAQKVVNDLNIISYKEQLYVYHEGYYRNSEEMVIKEITRIVNGIKHDLYSNGIRGNAENVLHNVKFLNPVTEYPFNKESAAIPVKNGIVLLEFEKKARKLVPYSPKYRFNYCIQTEYDENADSKPIDNIFKEYAPDQVEDLYQFPAQAILQMLGYGPFKKAYLFQGPPDAGKSSYLVLIHMAFGTVNISDVSLELLNPKENKFSLSSLEGKIFNIHDDMSYFSLRDTGTFKLVTGGYIIEIESKGKKRYTADIRAVHGFACNNPPKYDKDVKKDKAFWERWVYINFPNHFEKNPTFYQDNFTPKNLSGFLNKVLDTVLEIGHNKKLLSAYSYAEIRDKWAKCADPVYRFVTENMDPMQEGERPIYFNKDDFLSLLKIWAGDQGEEEDIPATVTMLSKNIEICRIDPDAKVTTGAGVREHVYGVPYKWKKNSKYNPTNNQKLQERGIKEVIPLKEQAKFTVESDS
jgi:putative DNA primase/helicase